MVKFQERKMKKRYKTKEYICKRYLMEFPVKMNPKIEPYKTKTFDDVEITSKETIEKEVVNISLVRNKSADEIKKWKPTRP